MNDVVRIMTYTTDVRYLPENNARLRYLTAEEVEAVLAVARQDAATAPACTDPDAPSR